jgi:hypothetical protein
MDQLIVWSLRDGRCHMMMTLPAFPYPWQCYLRQRWCPQKLQRLHSRKDMEVFWRRPGGAARSLNLCSHHNRQSTQLTEGLESTTPSEELLKMSQLLDKSLYLCTKSHPIAWDTQTFLAITSLSIDSVFWTAEDRYPVGWFDSQCNTT